MADDILETARRLARDSALWERVRAEGPAAADGEWQRLLATLRQLEQQLRELYPVSLQESEQQAFLATHLEASTLRRAPGQLLVDEYTMPDDRSQWRLRGTRAYAIDLPTAEASGWAWRGADGRFLSSEQLVAETAGNLLSRERAHRGIPERTS
jgi:hypothetical protein